MTSDAILNKDESDYYKIMNTPYSHVYNGVFEEFLGKKSFTNAICIQQNTADDTFLKDGDQIRLCL